MSKHYEILNNNISIVEKDIKKYSGKDKTYLIEKFLKDLKINMNDINFLHNSTKHKNLFTFNFKNKNYNVYIDHVDGGGKDYYNSSLTNIQNARKKINIPYGNTNFYNLLLKFENVLVVNIYFPFVKNFENNENNFFYFIVNPKEIYSSEPCKNLFHNFYKNNNEKRKVNGSNRWVTLQDILHCKESNNLFEINQKNNVYIIKNNKLYEFFSSKIINKEYKEMINKNSNDILDDIKNQIINSNRINTNTYSKYRNIFRINLIEEIGLQCQIKNCNITLKECLIASHIRSVKSIVNDSKININEKIRQIKDKNNGFLLCRNHDCLFDKYLITFDKKNANLICSKYIGKYLKQFNIYKKTQNVEIKSQKVYEYLKYHVEEFFSRTNFEKSN